ncbi:hypothetical protein P4S72_22180 [Vibrio sp. PP-XX7]
MAGQAVYAGTKNAVRTINEALRIEAGKLESDWCFTWLRENTVYGFNDRSSHEEKVKAAMDIMGISPDAIARAIIFAIDHPDDVDVGDIVVRPTAQA